MKFFSIWVSWLLMTGRSMIAASFLVASLDLAFVCYTLLLPLLCGISQYIMIGLTGLGM